MRVLLTLLGTAALLLTAQAAAGGFATVQLDSLPAGTGAGGTWTPTLTVLQHGITPLDGVTPVVRISNGENTLEFVATRTGQPGKYRVEVEFPTAGSWRYEIDDGFSRTHTYAPIVVGAAATGGGEEGRAWWVPLVGGLTGAAALALVGLVLRRRHARHEPSPRRAPSRGAREARPLASRARRDPCPRAPRVPS